MELILTENPSRFVLFPIVYPKIYEMGKKAQASIWSTEEIDFAVDLNDWKFKLKDNERYFIMKILCFFAASDGIVIENLIGNFSSEVKVAEARFFYGVQNFIENIHSETYSVMIDTLIKDEKLKLECFKSLDNDPYIAKKANWAIEYFNADKYPFRNRLIAFLLVEGVFFSGSFCSIFWLKKRSLLPGLTFANELISRDEGMHAEFACLLYSYLEQRLSEDEIYGMFREAVELETEFVTSVLPVDLIGMNKILMVQYVQFVADYWLRELGYGNLYGVKNPFDFMDIISIDGKTNFFGLYFFFSIFLSYFLYRKESWRIFKESDWRDG